jgi:hypothetical protein
MKLYNRIDYFRKLGAFLGMFFFTGAFIYLYKSNVEFKYKNLIMILFLISAIWDIINTIDAFKVHGNFLLSYNDTLN